VLLLSGVDVLNRTDEQMMYAIHIKIIKVLTHLCFRAATYYMIPPNSPPWEGSPLGSIAELPIPVYSTPVQQHPLSPSNEGPVPFVPGGGLTRRILTAIPAQWRVPTGALLQFAAEGDNRTDAAFMASVVAKIFSLDGKIQKWVQPKSWQQGLFGTPHDQSLYG
jgi:proteasome assembly chaperone 2